MRILIVKLSSIGDIIHTLPVIPAILKEIPNAEISWIAEKGSAEILRENPLLKKLFEVDTKSLRKTDAFRKNFTFARETLRSLRAEKFDIAIDFQGLLKSASIAKLSNSKRRYGFNKVSLREPMSRFLLTDTFSVETNRNIIVKNLSLIHKALDIPVPAAGFDFPIYTNPGHKEEAEKIVSQTGGKFVILNPATSWVTKHWDAEKYGQLADLLWEKYGLHSIVTTAPNEKNLAEKVLKSSKSSKIIASTPSLKGFYELAKSARVYVGGDTGPTFLAVAAKTPIVGIFGPTEWWRNGSPNEADICIERTDIDCRVNCHRRICSNWICMDINVKTVFEAVGKRLASGEK